MVWLSLARSLPIAVLLTTLWITGVGVSRLVGNSFGLLARGFHKLVDCTRCITFGSIRACRFFHSYSGKPKINDSLGPRRNLETRKEMRENAWQLDGWAGTVHKARLEYPHLFVT